MKYDLPSTELIVIEKNNYLKFGEYLNDMQCDDTTNKLCLDDLEYVKKLQQENQELKDNWNKLKEYLKSYIKLMNDNPDIIEQGQLDILYEVKDTIQELEQGSDSNVKN